MKPFSAIRVMDVYRNPITGSEWVVVEKNAEEEMVQVAMIGHDVPIWKRNTDRLFNFPCVQEGYE